MLVELAAWLFCLRTPKSSMRSTERMVKLCIWKVIGRSRVPCRRASLCWRCVSVLLIPEKAWKPISSGLGSVAVRYTHLLDELLLLLLDLEDLRLHGVFSDKLINMNWFLLANSIYPIDSLAFYPFLLYDISEPRRYYFTNEWYKPATIWARRHWLSVDWAPRELP